MNRFFSIVTNPAFWRSVAGLAKMAGGALKGTWNAFGSNRNND